MWSARILVNRVLPIILLTNLALVALVITYRTVGRGLTSGPVDNSEAAAATAAFSNPRGAPIGPGNPSVGAPRQGLNPGPPSSVSEPCAAETWGCFPPSFDSTALRAAGAIAADDDEVQFPLTLCEDVPSSDEACEQGNITIQTDDGAPGSIGCPIVDGNAGGTACNAVAVAAQGEAPRRQGSCPATFSGT